MSFACATDLLTTPLHATQIAVVVWSWWCFYHLWQEDCSHSICTLPASQLVCLSSLPVPLQVVFPTISPGATALAAHKWLMDAQKKVEEGGAGCLLQTVVFLLMPPAVRCSLGLTMWPDSPSA